VAIVTKLDLEAVRFDLEALAGTFKGSAPGMPILQVSTRAGQGLQELEQFLVFKPC
jgi:Ni2+-binding GTPase involved in maturation of urease and hydrogenase